MSCGSCITIKRVANGFTVRMTDPKIVEANNKRDRNGSSPYRDPEVSFAFDNAKQAMKFVVDNIDKALPPDEFDTSFKKALTSVDINK